jgi:hypothetical protein
MADNGPEPIARVHMPRERHAAFIAKLWILSKAPWTELQI